MFTFNERDLQRMPKPAKAHLPIRNDIDLSLIDDETGREHEVIFTAKSQDTFGAEDHDTN